jgi:hypothetical protein
MRKRQVLPATKQRVATKKPGIVEPTNARSMMDTGEMATSSKPQRFRRSSRMPLGLHGMNLRRPANRKTTGNRPISAPSTRRAGLRGRKGYRGGPRTHKKVPPTKEALDQQLNRYFAADPSIYRGQLDRELDEMMQDVSHGQQ